MCATGIDLLTSSKKLRLVERGREFYHRERGSQAEEPTLGNHGSHRGDAVCAAARYLGGWSSP